MHRYKAGRRRGAMINGCLLLVAVLAVVVTLAGKFAGYPPFHVAVATITVMFALILARTPDTRWQVEALAAVGAPAIMSVIYAYTVQPDVEALSGTSGCLYVGGAVVFVLTCIVRARRGGDPSSIEAEGEN